MPTRLSIQEIANSFKLCPEDMLALVSGSRKRNLTPTKLSLIKKALEEKYTLSEIALFLNTTQSAISKLLSRNVNKS